MGQFFDSGIENDHRYSEMIETPYGKLRVEINADGEVRFSSVIATSTTDKDSVRFRNVPGYEDNAYWIGLGFEQRDGVWQQSVGKDRSWVDIAYSPDRASGRQVYAGDERKAIESLVEPIALKWIEDHRREIDVVAHTNADRHVAKAKKDLASAKHALRDAKLRLRKAKLKRWAMHGMKAILARVTWKSLRI